MSLPELRPGLACPMKTSKVLFNDGDLELTFSPPRNKRFVFLFLGIEEKGKEPLQPDVVLEAMGWEYTGG